MEIWIVALAVATVVSNALWLFFWNRERWRRKELEQRNPMYRECLALVTDLNRLAGGVVEIRRVDPSSVFLYSPQ